MQIAVRPRRRKRLARAARSAALGIAIIFGGPVDAGAQVSGSSGAAVAGGALGAASGAALALFGSLVPCSQTRPGPACVRWSAVGGGALGLTGGAFLGHADVGRLRNAAWGAGVGLVAGATGALLLRSAAERFGWQDVAVVGVLGGAIGAVPVGSAFGLAGGTALGLAARALVPSFDTPDLIGAAVAGLALGGLAEWLVRGIGAGPGEEPSFSVVLPVAVGF